jgi:transcriptional regulator with XRE-family HTH domain
MHWILNNIKRIRISRNYTQQYLASELGISMAWYNKLENGHKSFRLDQIDTIAKILDVPISSITETNNMPLPNFQQFEKETPGQASQLGEVLSEMQGIRKMLEERRNG